MYFSSGLSLVFLTAVSHCSAIPLTKRRVPQEHSHEEFLTTVKASLDVNNPNEILDPVFGLLGNEAAAAGQGKITDTDCLQAATADQAFTNAKAAGDVNGQVAALIYRALERNTAKVGLASAECASFKPANPEIAAISQHQDSSAGASTQAANKANVLELAKQIKAVGGDPILALKSGTFAPANLDDSTGRGGACDVANDAVGCIFTQNLLVDDATEDEINAAVAGTDSSATSTPASQSQSLVASQANCPPPVTITVTGTAPTATAASQETIQNSNSNSNAKAASGGKFGTCTNPTVEFGAGLDGRKSTEFSFINIDQKQFPHGSALDPTIIFQFTCDNLVNSCGLINADAIVQTCRQANTDASALGKVGAAADLFNGRLGFKTDFASVNTNVTATTSS